MFRIPALTVGFSGLVLACSYGWGAQDVPIPPTLARLALYVGPGQAVRFTAAYDAKLLPILRKHGLVSSPPGSRAIPDSIFCRLFQVGSLAEVGQKQTGLERDPEWREALVEVGELLSGSPEGGPVPWRFHLYSTPAGPGTTTAAGPGRGNWRTYDTDDGLGGGKVYSIVQDRDGYLWFPTDGGGVSRYDGQTWVTFTTEDGLAHNSVFSGYQDQAGDLWFGTNGGGISRYDGETWTSFTTEDGLVSNRAFGVTQDRAGAYWFCSSTGAGGVSRYDGQTWKTFTTQDGLLDNAVDTVLEDSKGRLWFGSQKGVTCFDGRAWTTYGEEYGVGHVFSMCEDRDGRMWFGSLGNGVARYDGTDFVIFTADSGLPSNIVLSVYQARSGHMWFGTLGGGVSRYDGHNWTTFAKKDGLAHDIVFEVFEDRDGYL